MIGDEDVKCFERECFEREKEIREKESVEKESVDICGFVTKVNRQKLLRHPLSLLP